jgi:predicted ATPase
MGSPQAHGNLSRLPAKREESPLIKSLQFNFGAGPGQPRLRCSAGTITIFVGPNNAGKSRALTEIAEAIGVRPPSQKDSALFPFKSGIAFDSPPRKQVILRGIKVSLPRDAALRTAFIKVVAKDLADLSFKSKEMQKALSQWGPVSEFMRLLIAPLQATEFMREGKLNPRKTGIHLKDPSSTDEQALKAAIEELFQHAQENRFQKLARRWIAKGIVNLTGYAHLLVPHTIVLDGTARLTLVNATHSPKWREREDNLLANLVKAPERLEALRRIVHGAIGYFPVIDATHAGSTQLKMSKEPPEGKERSTEQEALQYFDRALSIADFSDGVRSFVGLLSAVMSGDHKVILIDEPEAFLHPPLTRRLGVELHNLAREHHAQVFAATHSPDFLMGCIQSGTHVSLVRLTYKDGQASARELKPERIKSIMRHPLLRSTGVLGALFHAGAVVCESDSDRAFYQELNERLLAKGRGAPGAAFLNAQNKQTIERIIAPLREMGVPAAAVLDLDVLSPGEDLTRLLMAAGTSPAIRTMLTSSRDRFFQRCMALHPSKEETLMQLKRKGLHVLPEPEREEFQSFLLKPLAELGIFVVPEGELESWLPVLAHGIGRSDKSKWLVKVFEQLGDDPEHPKYVHPEQEGVWAFVDAIARWIAEPKLGMPVPH